MTAIIASHSPPSKFHERFSLRIKGEVSPIESYGMDIRYNRLLHSPRFLYLQTHGELPPTTLPVALTLTTDMARTLLPHGLSIPTGFYMLYRTRSREESCLTSGPSCAVRLYIVHSTILGSVFACCGGTFPARHPHGLSWLPPPRPHSHSLITGMPRYVVFSLRAHVDSNEGYQPSARSLQRSWMRIQFGGATFSLTRPISVNLEITHALSTATIPNSSPLWWSGTKASLFFLSYKLCTCPTAPSLAPSTYFLSFRILSERSRSWERLFWDHTAALSQPP